MLRYVMVMLVLLLGLQVFLARAAEQAAPHRSVLALGQGIWGREDAPPPHHVKWNIPDPILQKHLKELGFAFDVTVYSPTLTWDYLKQFNTVVLIGMPVPERAGQDEQMVRSKLELLHRYVAEGGGVLLLHAPDWSFGLNVKSMNAWLKRYGAEVLFEQVVEADASRRFKRFGLRSELAWTDNIAEHALTHGVEGYWYPLAHSDWNSFAQPVKVCADWTVLVSGTQTARSVRSLKAGTAGEFREEPGTCQSAPPMIAARQADKGRLAIWPVASTCVWQDGYHPRWGEGLLMDGTLEGKRGSALQLLRNLLVWLSEPSVASGTLGGYSAPLRSVKAYEGEAGFIKIDWDRAHARGKLIPNCYVGLIGAQSELSVGKGRPEEFIAAAREAGYDFIAFTEDFAHMSPKKTERLIRVCSEGSTPTFQAVPGFYYLDEAGNAHVVFGPKIYWPRDEWISKKKPGRITTNNVLFRGFSFMPLAVVKSGRNPKKPWFLGNYKGFAVYTYEDGELVDDALKQYRYLQSAHFNLFPFALHLVRSPDRLKAERSVGMQTYIRWFSPADPITAITGHLGAVHEGRNIWYYPSFVSDGPIIEDFWVRNFGSSDLAMPGNDRFRIHMLVSSPAGLKFVDLFDGQELRYRYRVGGKQFEQEVDGFHDSQHHPLLEVTDAAGRRAIGWTRHTQVQEYYFIRCSDNFNTMTFGKWYNSRIKPLRGIEDYIGLTPRNVLPRVFVDRGPSKRLLLPDTNRPAVLQDVLVAGRFGSVVEYKVDEHYPPTASANWNKAVIEPTLPNENARYTVRVTRYCPRPDSPIIDLVETEIMAKRDLRLTSQSPGGTIVAHSSATNSLRNLLAIEADGKVTAMSMDLAPTQQNVGAGGVLGDGTYAAVFPALGGSAAFVALQPGLIFRAGRHRAGKDVGTNLFIYSPDAGRRLKAGETLTYRLLSVNSGRGPRADNRFVEDIRMDMGLNPQRHTAYAVNARRGRVVSTRYVLQLEATDGVFSGTITEAHLPIDLPVRIDGLNPRWDAVLWYRGNAKLYVPIWEFDEVWDTFAVRHRRTLADELRHIPVWQGGAMLQIDTEMGDKDVFVGHPVQASDARVWIILEDTRKGKETLFLHNSEEEPITCEVWRDADFGLIPAFRRKVTIPAGQSLRIHPARE